MTLITIYKIDGGNSFNLELANDYKIKTKELKEYISEYYGIDAEEVKLYIRFSSNNKLKEKKDGDFFEGLVNRYLFTINPYFEPEHYESKEIEDSLSKFIKSS
jgi:hypothetical protein